ncbi:hypothetical protein AN478_07570 [Thiohalorhabdus denitrificans]|uniref:Glycosyltransferase involved in cell wall bisynthesis n=1 Tax=Thiohalorhabdus denitrificans TaxID=381306 RepID=A0A0P9CAK4_9GAMM|nr:glycosyltransferase [Thiohalorhabdus denitrificans]KPV40027.1 hypothetical protein AN478_07570 [Thiohalorhabdus denitrificans]SCY12597.1 Glycosyltransferase involved in cell wall bisynthesis [Thiohalorhabdus denitrificans]
MNEGRTRRDPQAHHPGEEEGKGPETDIGTLLIVTSDFPPLAGTNTQRVQSFVRHLPDFGWRCRVITRAVEDMGWIDSGELAHLPPDLAIERVPSPDPFAVRRRRLGARPYDIHAAGEAEWTPSREEAGQGAGIAERARKAVSQWLHDGLDYGWYVPDSSRPWADAAARRGVRIAGEGGADVLLTSCPSYSSHVAGLKIKRRTGLPWVADFRDLWVERPGRRVRSRWHAFRDRHLEAVVLREADRVVVTSPAWQEALCRQHGEWLREKMAWIPNGYDPSKDSGMPRAGDRDRYVLRLVYTGAMDASVSPLPLIEALGRLKERHPHLMGRFQVRLVGYAGHELSRLESAIAGHGLEPYVELLGTQSHERCLREQAEADVLLLFSAPCHRDTITGKSFEYMRSGRPILAMIPRSGAQAQILRAANTAWILDYSDVDGAMRTLERLARGPGAPRVEPRWDYIRQFDRHALAGTLAGVLAALPAGRA